MQIECPHCQTLLEISEPVDAQITCPSCGGEISIPAEEPEIKLDALRIRQLSAARRAAYRTRSYCLIGALFCIAAAIQFAWSGITHWPNTLVQTIAFFVLAIFSAWGGIFFLKRATEFSAEVKGFPLDDPTPPPDFSTLSDGSDRFRKLEEMSRPRDEDV